jgi:hypothetical protein
VSAFAMLIAASAAVPACAQSMLPGTTQPARSLPAQVAPGPRLATVAPRTMLRNVTILRGQTSVEVHIEASGPVKPMALVLSEPERIVVDLADVGYDGSRRLPVNADDVEGVRVALHQANPPVTRVVVDLAHPHEYRLLSAGKTVILAIDTRPKPAIAAQPAVAKAAALVAASTAPPAATPPASNPPPGAPSEPPAESVAGRATQPSVPTVSTTLPQVATLPVPAGSAQPSAATEEEETTAHQAAKGNKPGLVRSVTVSRRKDAIEVRIEGSNPLRASASTLSNPERIIIDLANVRLRHERRIPVNAAGVQAVNVSLYLVNPLVTRVVVDLAHPHPYHLQASGNSLTVRIETDEIKSAGSQPAR